MHRFFDTLCSKYEMSARIFRVINVISRLLESLSHSITIYRATKATTKLSKRKVIQLCHMTATNGLDCRQCSKLQQ